MPDAERSFCGYCGNVRPDGHQWQCSEQPVGRRYRCPVCARESYEGQRTADARHRTACRWFGDIETGRLEPVREPSPAAALEQANQQSRRWSRR
jgi:hypothetical protein